MFDLVASSSHRVRHWHLHNFLSGHSSPSRLMVSCRNLSLQNMVSTIYSAFYPGRLKAEISICPGYLFPMAGQHRGSTYCRLSQCVSNRSGVSQYLSWTNTPQNVVRRTSNSCAVSLPSFTWPLKSRCNPRSALIRTAIPRYL